MSRKESFKVRTSDYTRAGHAAFQKKFSLIAYSILAHPEVFSNVSIPASELVAMAKNLMAATNEAANGGSRASRDERNILRARATTMLNRVADSVAVIAGRAATDETAMRIMNLSGFAVKKTKYTRTDAPGQVGQVRAIWTGNTGQAFIRWKKIRAGVLLYNVEINYSNVVESSEWHFVKSTVRSKTVLNNLPRLSACWVRVTAISTRNRKSVPSGPALISIRSK